MTLTKENLEVLFYKLGDELHRRKELVDITVYGGCALLLKYGLRDETKDVDAYFDNWDAHTLETLAKTLANEHGLDDKWLNNDAEIFKADKEDLDIYKKYPDAGKYGLRISVPKPDYMLALQVQRLSTMTEQEFYSKESKSLKDIVNLSKLLNYDRNKTLSAFNTFYPKSFFTKSVVEWVNRTFEHTHEMEMKK